MNTLMQANAQWSSRPADQRFIAITDIESEVKIEEKEHWTPEVDKESERLFSSFSESEIRSRQNLCTKQIEVAHKKGYTRALKDLRKMEEVLTREMLRRTEEGTTTSS